MGLVKKQMQHDRIQRLPKSLGTAPNCIDNVADPLAPALWGGIFQGICQITRARNNVPHLCRMSLSLLVHSRKASPTRVMDAIHRGVGENDRNPGSQWAIREWQSWRRELLTATSKGQLPNQRGPRRSVGATVTCARPRGDPHGWLHLMSTCLAPQCVSRPCAGICVGGEGRGRKHRLPDCDPAWP